MQLFNQYHNQDIKYFPYLKMFLVFIYRQSPSPPPLQFLTTFDHFVSLWALVILWALIIFQKKLCYCFHLTDKSPQAEVRLTSMGSLVLDLDKS